MSGVFFAGQLTGILIVAFSLAVNGQARLAAGCIFGAGVATAAFGLPWWLA